MGGDEGCVREDVLRESPHQKHAVEPTLLDLCKSKQNLFHCVFLLSKKRVSGRLSFLRFCILVPTDTRHDSYFDANDSTAQSQADLYAATCACIFTNNYTSRSDSPALPVPPATKMPPANTGHTGAHRFPNFRRVPPGWCQASQESNRRHLSCYTFVFILACPLEHASRY